MRKLELAANLMLVFGPIAIALLFLILLTPTLTIPASSICFGIGLAFLVRAKLDCFKRKIWVSFGAARMNAASRHSYWQAYGFIAVGVALNMISQLTLYNAH